MSAKEMLEAANYCTNSSAMGSGVHNVAAAVSELTAIVKVLAEEVAELKGHGKHKKSKKEKE